MDIGIMIMTDKKEKIRIRTGWKLGVLGALLMLGGLAGCGGRTADTSAADKGNVLDMDEPREVAQALGLGWNLGNQMDAQNDGVAIETGWGNEAATQATFDSLARAGFGAVRIPVTWLGHIGEAPEYRIDSLWLNRVDELVGYAERAGLKAIVNIHHDGADGNYWLSIREAAADSVAGERIKAELKAVWTQIAERMKERGSFLVFEAANEIHDGGWGWGGNRTDDGHQYRILNEWNQLFVDAVRATGGENTRRYLGIPGYCADPELTMEHMVLPKDPTPRRLMVSVHYYAPVDYTLTDKFSEWGHTARADRKDSWGDEDKVREIFGRLQAKYVDQGIPCYVGEIGCVHRDDPRAEAFRKYYLEYVFKAARTYGLAPFYWDNGLTGAGRECSGLVDHATGRLLNNAAEVIGVMRRALSDDDDNYTLETIQANAPQ